MLYGIGGTGFFRSDGKMLGPSRRASAAGSTGSGFKKAMEKRHEGFGITTEDAIEALRMAFEEDLLGDLDLDRC
jgi:hypothetical protein